MTDQLTHLVKPFPDALVFQRPQGGRQVDYVAHGQVTAKLLATVGPFSMDVGHVTGDTWKVTLNLTIDGHPVTVADVSTADEPETAVSRAFCRAAMRAGVGLHLWAQNDLLYRQLNRRDPQDPRDLHRQAAVEAGVDRLTEETADVGDYTAEQKEPF